MKRMIIFVIAALVFFCRMNSAFAMAPRPKDPGKTGTFVIDGTVIDRAANKPIAGAEVSVSLGSTTQKAETDSDGKYQVLFAGSVWLRSGVITASAGEYRAASSRILILHINRKRTVNFSLFDIVKPSLEIISPADEAGIFPETPIELRYADGGSGIDPGSVSISIDNKQQPKKYIDSIDTSGAIYRFPAKVLGYGRHLVSAVVKDHAGNQAKLSIYVTVIAKADYYVRLGKIALVDADIAAAYDNFKKAIEAGPKNKEANLYFGLARAAMLLRQDEVFFMLRSMGFRGPGGAPLGPDHLDPFDLRIEAPAGISKFNLPDSSPGGRQIQDVIENNIIPEIDGAVGNLNVVLADKHFVSELGLTIPLAGSEKIGLDYSDIALIKSMLLFVNSIMHEMLVNDIDIEPGYIKAFLAAQPVTFWRLFELYPELMRVRSLPHSLRARDSLVGSVNSFIAGFANMLYIEDHRTRRLFMLSRDRQPRNDAMLFVDQLRDIKKSLLSSPDRVFSLKFSQLINAGYLFTSPFDLRRAMEPDCIEYVLKDGILPHLDYAAANLSKARITFRQFLPFDNSIYRGMKKEFDYADIKASSAGIDIARTALLSVLAYDTRTAMQTFAPGAPEDKRIYVQALLDNSPNLLSLSKPDHLYAARDAFSSAVKNYSRAGQYLLRRQDKDQSDHVLVVTDSIAARIKDYGTTLNEMSLMRKTSIDPLPGSTGDEFYVNLAEFFVRHKDIGAFVPRFDSSNKLIPGTYPDENFGGIISRD